MQVFLLFTISIQFHILANDFHERAPPSCPQLIGTRENPKEIDTLFSFLVFYFFFDFFNSCSNSRKGSDRVEHFDSSVKERHISSSTVFAYPVALCHKSRTVQHFAV